MTLVESVRAQVAPSVLVRRCNKSGCNVPLKGVPQPHLVLDLDKPGSPLGQSETRCDYLIVGENSGKSDWAVALELKRGQVHADVANQLQAGANVTDQLVPPKADIDFKPVVAGRGFHSHLKRTLAKRKVQFRQKQLAVILISCGTPLAKVAGF